MGGEDLDEFCGGGVGDSPPRHPTPQRLFFDDVELSPKNTKLEVVAVVKRKYSSFSSSSSSSAANNHNNHNTPSRGRAGSKNSIVSSHGLSTQTGGPGQEEEEDDDGGGGGGNENEENENENLNET